MKSTLKNISKKLNGDQVCNLLFKNYEAISADWTFHQWNWLHQNYQAFNDLIKYLIILRLAKETLEFYYSTSSKYTYDEYYSYPELQIANFNISELAKEFSLPKETMRRKIMELENSKVIRRQGKNLFIDRSAYNLIKPINQINITSKYISNVSKILFEAKLIDSEISQDEIKDLIKKRFSQIWLWFYDFQLPVMLNWKNYFGDINMFYIWGTLALNQVYNQKNLNHEIKSTTLDDYTNIILSDAQTQSGLNIMSISEMTKIPRATVIRKVKALEKKNLLISNEKKQYYLVKQLSASAAIPLMKKNFMLKGKLISKILNLIIV